MYEADKVTNTDWRENREGAEGLWKENSDLFRNSDLGLARTVTGT